MNIAVTVSVAVHAALLMVHFTAPDTFRSKPADLGLELILVNAKHDKKPLKADALAQANLDGGGNADSGRATSPLPDLGKVEDGDSVAFAKKRQVELEQEQRSILAQVNKKTSIAMPLVTSFDKVKDAQPQSDGFDLTESTKALMRKEAEINKRIEDENKRPKKTYISPSTMGVNHAFYYNAMRRKIEQRGEYRFPTDKNGKKLYGELIMTIYVAQDGSIYKGNASKGIEIDVSSGNAVLDAAARRIVELSAPFGHIPKSMKTGEKDELFVMVTKFRFTREDTLETEMRGAKN